MPVLSALHTSRRPVLGFVAMGLVFGSFAAFLPVLKARIGADDALFGLLLLGSPIGLALTLWLAPAFDRRLAAFSMPAAAIATALSMVATGFAVTPAAFFAAMVLVGVCAGTLDIVSNARVSELEAHHRAPLMNANHAMFSVAYAASAVATGAAREAGMSPAAVFTAIALLILAATLRMRMAPAATSEAGPRPVGLPGGAVALCGGIVLVAFFVEAVVESWSALHVERTLQGGAAEGAFGPAILGLTMAAGRFAGQVAAGRLSDLSIISGGSVMACVGAMLAAVAPAPWVAYLGFGLMGLGMSVVGPMALALVGRIVPPSRRTAAVARVNVIGFGAFLLAPVLMGQLSDAYGLRVAFAVVGGTALVAPLLAFLLRSRWAPGPA
ncbi:MFS transporter [Roseibacterium sp. SDUM158016]|jgi:MFS family permease|uniref:MFS transporter n=1 Tax=Roseicyclus sediminis TaxID=2980997 RepID=UPI0021CE4066|nr:MFS transporter [Roseibacterium sp. SDUM158016]MCU4654831.1 MFS transporter [Roseibacterium sp. SDUM158016]